MQTAVFGIVSFMIGALTVIFSELLGLREIISGIEQTVGALLGING